MRYVLALALCGTLYAAEGVAVSVDENTKTATVTITVDVTAVLDSVKDKKTRTLQVLDVCRKMLDRAQTAVAFETSQAIDAEASKQITEQTARVQLEAAKQKAALPVSNVKDAPVSEVKDEEAPK